MIKKFAALLMCFSLGVIAVSGCSKKEEAVPAEGENAAPAEGETTPAEGETTTPAEGSGE